MCCNYHNICAYISVSICPAMNVIHLLNEFSNVYSNKSLIYYYPQYIYMCTAINIGKIWAPRY